MKLDVTNDCNARYLAMLPYWKCHKIVQAGKISLMARDEPNQLLMVHAEPSNMPFAVPLDFLYRHNPTIGGYFVVYEDGYISYSPTAPFEAGYHLLEGEPDAQMLQEAGKYVARADWALEADEAPNNVAGVGVDLKTAFMTAYRQCEQAAYDYSHSLPEGPERELALKVYHAIRLAFSKGKSGLSFVDTAPGVNLHNLDRLETDMPPHQLRVMEELADLAMKLQKLTVFFDTDTYRALDVDERGRLKEQSLFMQEYQRVLVERVAAFQ